MVVNEEVVGLLLAKFLKWISPKDVAHEAVGWGFPETVNL